MASATQDGWTEFDFARARWMIEIFDEACRDLPNQPPSEDQRKLLAAAVVQAATLHGCRDRIKLKDAALKHVRMLRRAD